MQCKTNLPGVTPDAERLIGKIARVSNPANEDNPEAQNSLST